MLLAGCHRGCVLQVVIIVAQHFIHIQARFCSGHTACEGFVHSV
ncbi:hypothetical protein [Desulfovibrio cuneatus]